MAAQLSVYSVSIGSSSGEEVQLAVHECSPAEGYRKTPILCVPGLWSTARSFDDLVCRLASSSGRRVLALSMRGHGGSSKSDCSLYTVSEAAYDVCAALRVLALESTVLLGHGVGAMVATRVAMLEPGRVAGLILCSGVRKLKMTANWGGNHRATCTLDALIKRIAPSKADESDPWAADDALWRAAAELTSAREETAAAAAGSPSLEDLQRSAPSALRSMLRSSLVSEVTSEALAAYTGRTLLLWGTDDVFSTLTEQLELLRLLKPRAELKQIDGGGHSLLWEAKRAGAVCEALTEFVLSLEEGSTGLRRSKSTTAALQAYGDAVSRALLKVESRPHETPEQTLRRLLTAAAGSLLPPPPPPNKGNRSISQVRAAVKLLNVPQLEGLVAKLGLKVTGDADHNKLCVALMASASFVRSMRNLPSDDTARAEALAASVAEEFVEKQRTAVQAQWAKRDAGRAPFESRLPEPDAVRARVRGEVEALSERRIRKMVQTESLENLQADWQQWLQSFLQRSEAMVEYKAALAKMQGAGTG